MTFIGAVRNVMCGRVLAAAVSCTAPLGGRAGGDVPPVPAPYLAATEAVA